MSLQVQSIIPNSLAEKNGLKVGDIILSMNNKSIDDFIDLQFYGADRHLQIVYLDQSGIQRILEIEQNWQNPLGIEPIPHSCRMCVNHCVFCFIDQMRPQLREALYDKDDDYLFSFVFGNFITLTNISDRDIRKIITQRLSPLYISVHTTNSDLRQKMMGYRQSVNVMEIMRTLSENGIEMHVQIVVVPEWNDGSELEKTLLDLCSSDLNVLSIGVVPVGLTKYRKHLPVIRPVDARKACEILDMTRRVSELHQPNKIFCADELYNLCEEEIPADEFYGDYPQLENGIGMSRLMLENWKNAKREFIKDIQRWKHNLVMITGTSAFPLIQKIANDINNKLGKTSIRVQAVTNKFLGETVTVAGLLAFSDIQEQVILQPDEIPVFCSNLFNNSGLTIDDVEQSQIKEVWQRDILIVDQYFQDWELI
jgi:putative radical SAM enzyme (TIGR03279 family)